MSNDSEFYKSVAVSQGHDDWDLRPGQPTVSTLTAGTGLTGAHEADVVAQAVMQNAHNLSPQMGPHMAHPLFNVPRMGYSDKLGTEGEINGALGGIKAQLGYQAEGNNPIDGPSPEVPGEENHQAASNLAPVPKAAQ